MAMVCMDRGTGADHWGGLYSRHSHKAITQRRNSLSVDELDIQVKNLI